MDWLDRLRAKPERVRFQVAVLIAGGITAVIFLVWLSVITLTLGESSMEETESREHAQKSFVEDARASFVELIGEGSERFKAFFDKLGTTYYEAEER